MTARRTRRPDPPRPRGMPLAELERLLRARQAQIPPPPVPPLHRMARARLGDDEQRRLDSEASR